jgi:hypothetical protein
MLNRHVHVVLLSIAILCQFATAQERQPAETQGSPPLPTMDELRQMYDHGDYQAAVQQIARVLRLRVRAGQAVQPRRAAVAARQDAAGDG